LAVVAGQQVSSEAGGLTAIFEKRHEAAFREAGSGYGHRGGMHAEGGEQKEQSDLYRTG